MKKIFKMVLAKLKVDAFAKDESGKHVLTEEQRGNIEAAWGKSFLEKFEASLDADEDDSDPEAVTALINAISANSGDQVAQLSAQLQTALGKIKTLQSTVAQLADSPENEPEPETNTSMRRDAELRSVLKIDYKNPLYAALKGFLESGQSHLMAGSTIDVADLKTEFGTYLSQQQNALEISKQIFTGFTSAGFFRTIPAVTEYRALQALITSVSQQFTNKWNPGGKTKFKPLLIKNYRHKINFPIIPSEVLDTYMFKMYDEGLAPDQMPITRYIWNELLYPALMQDIEMRMIWKGKFVDRTATMTAGAPASAPEDSMDGIETILVEAKTAGDTGIHFFNKYPKYNFKTATDQEVLDFFEDYVDWMSPFFKTKKMNLYVSDDHKRRYKRAYKKIWGVNGGVSGDFGEDRIDYSNQMLVAPDGMFNSQIVFSTVDENMVKLRHKNQPPLVINDVQKFDYEVRLYGEYWLGVGFLFGEAVFAFVPAGYKPKAQIDETLGDFDDYQEYNVEQFKEIEAGGGV